MPLPNSNSALTVFANPISIRFAAKRILALWGLSYSY